MMDRKLVPAVCVAGAMALTGAMAEQALSKDYNCSDFRTQKQAQKFFKKHHHARQDRLDADHDGIACEALP
jgi:micrococcal nuclease